MVNLTPEQFIQAIVDRVEQQTRKVLAEKKPAQNYTVNKQTPTGPMEIITNVPQAMTDLAQQLVVASQTMYRMTAVMGALITELEEHRKLGAKLSKKARRKEIEDEDED